ncbi:MFS transporter [Kribbella lupini]|uniref:Major facilitator superfamily (MFS) profile domain-containing protein n=1 Tax=Kribbella lupini TaxID=291602 RepID=A0ABP4L7D5_9ACTN
MATAVSVRPARVRQRLIPLRWTAFLQGIAFWVPVEKLFMTEIGFEAATIGVMAAAYAALVPVAEVLSGVLADRWSRRGVLVLAAIALLVAVLIGALSQNVITYIVAALVLGLYFALYSGTVEAIVYDTVLEETGSSTAYEREIGRIRLLESAALVTSALAGGWIAAATSTRLTYVVTLPFVIASLIALSRFREPRLHEAGERSPLREHLRTTVRAILHRGRLVPIAAAAVTAALILQAMYEFGPLWLIELSAPAGFYGPFWAGVVGALGLGGLLAGRLHLHRRLPVATVVLVMLGCAAVLLTSGSLAVLTIAIVVLTLLVVVIGIHVSHLVHDAVDSTVRTGVASGISAVSWILFTPFALGFGAVTQQADVYAAGWLLAGAVVFSGAALLWVVGSRPAGRSLA